MIEQNPAGFSHDLQHAPEPTTDDWPYVYHRSHNIPGAYLTISLVLLGIAFFVARRAFDPSKTSTWNFFFLGAGFLLLETQIISRLALYFGSTWLVNCVVLSMVLAVLMLSNFSRAAPSLLRWAAALVCRLAWLTIGDLRDAVGVAAVRHDWRGSVARGGILRAAVSGGGDFQRDVSAMRRQINLFWKQHSGRGGGRMAQSASFILGIKALLLVAGFFYLLAAVFGGLEERAVAGAPAQMEA